MTASNEALRARPTSEQIETSLRRIGTGQVRRCIPVEPDDDDVVLSNAVEHLTADLAAAREALARVRGTVDQLDRESAAIHLGELERNVAHYCIDALRAALLGAEPRPTEEPAPAPRCHFCLGTGLAQNVAPGVLKDQPCPLCASPRPEDRRRDGSK